MIIDEQIKEAFDRVSDLISDISSEHYLNYIEGKLLGVCLAQQVEIEFLYNKIENLEGYIEWKTNKKD